MDSPLLTPAVPKSEIPILNSYYLNVCPASSDPTMVWGTEVDTNCLTDYLRQRNAVSPVLMTGAHVLLKAVAEALVRHPQFNSRVLGRRLYRFKDVNLMMPLQNRLRDEADVLLINKADSFSVQEIASQVWKQSRNAARGEVLHHKQAKIYRRIPGWLLGWMLRLQLWITNHLNLPVNSINEQLRAAPVLVNYLAYHGAAPMSSFKPSCIPSDCWTLNVTMGSSEPRPVADGNRVAVSSVASLFVRADHRVVDAYELGKFVTELRTLLSDPWKMEAEIKWSKKEDAYVSDLYQTADGQYCPLPR